MQLLNLLFTLFVVAPHLSAHNLLSLQRSPFWVSGYFSTLIVTWPHSSLCKHRLWLALPRFSLDSCGSPVSARHFGSSLLAWPLKTVLFVPLVLDPLLLLTYKGFFLSHLLWSCLSLLSSETDMLLIDSTIFLSEHCFVQIASAPLHVTRRSSFMRPLCWCWNNILCSVQYMWRRAGDGRTIHTYIDCEHSTHLRWVHSGSPQ